MNSSKDDEMLLMMETKSKRDQYVVEIRKQKVEGWIKAKRLKLASNLPKNGSNKENKALNRTDGTATDEPNNEPVDFSKLASLFFKAIQEQNPNLISEAIVAVRKGISVNENPPIQEFLESGLFTHIIKFLDKEYSKYPELQYEVVWITANAFSGTPEQAEILYSPFLLKSLIKCIASPNIEFVEVVSIN